MSDRDSYADYDLMLLRETVSAILVRTTDEPRREIWLPRSPIPLLQKASRQLPCAARIRIPDWLAEKKGLLA